MTTSSKSVNGGGFKTKNKKLEGLIKKTTHDLAKLILQEKRSRNKWTRGYNKFVKTTSQLIEIRIHGTRKENRLRESIKRWPDETVILTRERDLIRERMEKKRGELRDLELELAVLKEQQSNQTKTIDEIVSQVFGLNDTVVRASKDREDCLTRHVFPRLVGENGKLLSQVTFDSADGLRRVVAIVNTMTLVQGDLASRAKGLIEKFFDLFKSTEKMDEGTKILYKLTHQLLVEKVDFKVGPDLYRFLSMELDPEIFPDLAQAQDLLRKSIRSEKTNSYIRIYERKSLSDKWLPVPQS